MILRAGDLASGSALDADVVVVGAGPVGLAVASGLADGSRRVLVVESGD